MGKLILILFATIIVTYFLFIFIQSYDKRRIFTQWLLFLPMSLFFTLSVGIILAIIFIGFFALREIVFLPLSWTICRHSVIPNAILRIPHKVS
jgi:hypothetical protein